MEALGAGRSKRVYRVDDPERVKDFYNAISSVYNKRNFRSPGIKSAHTRIVDAIKQIATQRAGTISILDIGGGTGDNIYKMLESDGRISWTYLDSSDQMAAAFREEFPRSRGGGLNVVNTDCLAFCDASGAANVEQFDVIVLSFVLSSLPRNIDFGKLRQRLNSKGVILIADIHPSLVGRSPFFDIEINREFHMLQLRKVEPMVLEVDASKSKIARSDFGLFYNKQREIYSFYLELRCLEIEPTPASKSVAKLKKEK